MLSDNIVQETAAEIPRNKGKQRNKRNKNIHLAKATK